MTRKEMAFMIIYLIGSITTFGHAWNNNSWSTYDGRALGSLASAVAWPVYFSVKLQED